MQGTDRKIRDLPPVKLALLMERLERRRQAGAPSDRPIPKRPAGDECEVSFAQQRLWFLQQLHPESGFYNCYTALRVRGRFRQEVFRQALATVVERHEVLRTSFRLRDGQPMQVIARRIDVPVGSVDLRSVEATLDGGELHRVLVQDSRRPFDLSQGPLLRARVLRLAGRESVVSFCIHHIVSDGWSMGILVQEISRLYEAYSRGLPSPLPALEVQYADFATWQRRRLEGVAMDRHVEFWKRRIGPAELGDGLPLDRVRPEPPTRRAGYCDLRLDRRVRAGLQEVARREDATLFMVLLAAFHVLLRFVSGRERVLVGSPVAGRNRPEIEGLVGFFINTLVLGADFSRVSGFRELLGQVRETCLEAFARQEVPFERLVEALRPSRSQDDTPLIQTTFTLQNAPTSALRISELETERIHLDEGYAKFDFMLDLWEAPDRIDATFTYDTDTLRDETVRRLAGHYGHVVERVAADPELSLDALMEELREADHRHRREKAREMRQQRGSRLKAVRRKGVTL